MGRSRAKTDVRFCGASGLLWPPGCVSCDRSSAPLLTGGAGGRFSPPTSSRFRRPQPPIEVSLNARARTSHQKAAPAGAAWCTPGHWRRTASAFRGREHGQRPPPASRHNKRRPGRARPAAERKESAAGKPAKRPAEACRPRYNAKAAPREADARRSARNGRGAGRKWPPARARRQLARAAARTIAERRPARPTPNARGREEATATACAHTDDAIASAAADGGSAARGRRSRAAAKSPRRGRAIPAPWRRCRAHGARIERALDRRSRSVRRRARASEACQRALARSRGASARRRRVCCAQRRARRKARDRAERVSAAGCGAPRSE